MSDTVKPWLWIDGVAVSRALEQSGSSMLTLGFDAPHGLARQLTSFAAAGVGLTLLALVIAYIPTVYAAFSRREALITKLTVRTGDPPTGPALLSSSWRLGYPQTTGFWRAKPCSTGPPHSSRQTAMCRAKPAASFAFTPGFTP